MARSNTSEEHATKKEMSRIYKDQEHDPNGFDDWGVFTAHVVHTQRKEIVRLRSLMQQNGVDPDPWQDPFDS